MQLYNKALQLHHVTGLRKGKGKKIRKGSSRRHRPPARESPPQAHVEEGPGRGAEGGERRDQKNSRTPWSRRKRFSPPYSAGHSPGG